mmetsp:Transcript_15632/g.47155  ORF Transcript_15632/g.47155 Transcript_15632/m.47155 type:complete len:248 (-) Transcript_15632:1656-2399(-)
MASNWRARDAGVTPRQAARLSRAVSCRSASPPPPLPPLMLRSATSAAAGSCRAVLHPSSRWRSSRAGCISGSFSAAGASADDGRCVRASGNGALLRLPTGTLAVMPPPSPASVAAAAARAAWRAFTSSRTVPVISFSTPDAFSWSVWFSSPSTPASPSTRRSSAVAASVSVGRAGSRPSARMMPSASFCTPVLREPSRGSSSSPSAASPSRGRSRSAMAPVAACGGASNSWLSRPARCSATSRSRRS